MKAGKENYKEHEKETIRNMKAGRGKQEENEGQERKQHGRERVRTLPPPNRLAEMAVPY